MDFEQARRGPLGQFAPLSPTANRIVTRIVCVAIIGVVAAEYIKGRADQDTWDCVLPSLDVACNPPRTLGQNVVTGIAGWDWMLISGLIVFAISLGFVNHLRPSFHRCVTRLFDRGVLRPGALDQIGLHAHFADGADRWALRLALIIALIMAIVWAIVLVEAFSLPKLGLAFAQILLGFVAGGYLGEMIFYGRLGRVIGTNQVKLHLDPWHADDAAGIKPVGDYVFFQATVATIPAAFLAVWIWIMPLWERYDQWYLPYIGLLCLAVLIQTLAIFLPLAGFHIEMLRQKREWRRKLDEVFRENAKARAALEDRTDPEQQETLAAALDHLKQRHRIVEAMPTWPIDRDLWRKFTIRNVFLVSPVVVDIVLGASNWAAIVKAVSAV
ncbi:MAG: hypothetical protein AAFQ09_10050 [Pseudomonadota bacterium]